CRGLAGLFCAGRRGFGPLRKGGGSPGIGAGQDPADPATPQNVFQSLHEDVDSHAPVGLLSPASAWGGLRPPVSYTPSGISALEGTLVRIAIKIPGRRRTAVIRQPVPRRLTPPVQVP